MTAPALKKQTNAEIVGKGVIALSTTVGSIVSLPLAIVLHAWALRALWGWFIVPAFHIAPLTLETAAGIGLIVRLMGRRGVDDPNDAERSVELKAFRSVGFAVLGPAVFWCAGWIVQWVAT